MYYLCSRNRVFGRARPMEKELWLSGVIRFSSFEVLQERKKFVSLQSRCDQAFGKEGLFGKKERH